MRPVTISIGPLTSAVANNIALSQTPAAGPLTLNGALVTGGIAHLDTPRQVLITTNDDETAAVFTITGTDWAGDSISEAVAGVSSATAASVLSYLTVTSITISVTAGAAITVGTNGVASSPWIRMDEWANLPITIQCVVTGTVSYTVQQTLDDPNSQTNPILPALINWFNSADSAVVTASATKLSYFTYPVIWTRVVLNSGTGSVVSTFVQPGVAPY